MVCAHNSMSMTQKLNLTVTWWPQIRHLSTSGPEHIFGQFSRILSRFNSFFGTRHLSVTYPSPIFGLPVTYFWPARHLFLTYPSPIFDVSVTYFWQICCTRYQRFCTKTRKIWKNTVAKKKKHHKQNSEKDEKHLKKVRKKKKIMPKLLQKRRKSATKRWQKRRKKCQNCHKKVGKNQSKMP